MTNFSINDNFNKIHTSTLLAVDITQNSRLGYFTITSPLSLEQGNQISFEFSKKNNLIKSIYYEGKFWIIRHKNDISNKQKWQEQLNQIKVDNQTEIGILDLNIKQLEKENQPPEKVIAKLAIRILQRQIYQETWKKIVYTDEHINIFRYLKISPEIFDNHPSVILNWKTSANYPGTLKQYFLKQQKKLVDLEVENRFIPSSRGIINKVLGFCNPKEKARLLSYPDLHPSTRQIIEQSNNKDLVVAVKNSYWGKESYAPYLLECLNIAINEKNADLLEIDYEFYRSQTRINLEQWQELLVLSYQKSSEALKEWELAVDDEYVSSQSYPQHFYTSPFDQENVKLLFGNNVIYSRKQIKLGLTKGGVYRRHENLSNPLQVIVLNLGQLKAEQFLNNLKSQLKSIKFEVNFLEKVSLDIQGNMSEKDAVLIEETIKRIVALEPDLVITILPKGDKKLDHTERGSYYYHIYQQLLPQGIASQMVTEENLSNQHILNNIVLGIIAKLGNLPFIFAEPLKVADYFIGLDVAHERKSKTRGTRNACACVRIYGAHGEFIKYKLADSVIEGEEIPIKVLRNLLPFDDLSRKTVLIFRDGRFRGNEISFLIERAEAIAAKFIFVEITKTGTCRLFDRTQHENRIHLQQPTQYLIFKHSEKEATITTTKPPISVGLTKPIRITIIENGIVPPLDDVIEATIKLCLLHHGSYKEAGTPMPIFASDKIGYKALKGLYHVHGEGEKQWWH